MLPQKVHDNQKRIDSLIMLMEAAAPLVDMKVQSVFASHLVILASGHIEISVREVLGEYALRRANPTVQQFVLKSLERENSLNCEKINKVLDKFDKHWKESVSGATTVSEREAVDSLKTLRDQIAHGKQNGTGYITVKGYYGQGCKYVGKLASFLNAH